LPVIAYSWEAGGQKVLNAFKEGAFDTLSQPLDVQQLRFALDRACRRGALSRELAEARRLLGSNRVQGLLGNSKAIDRVCEVTRKVAEVFGIKLSDMRAQNRTKSVAFPRQIAMYLSRQLTHASLSDVGRAFGGKDHTTVLHAVTKLQTLIQEDPKLKQTIDTLIQGISL